MVKKFHLEVIISLPKYNIDFLDHRCNLKRSAVACIESKCRSGLQISAEVLSGARSSESFQENHDCFDARCNHDLGTVYGYEGSLHRINGKSDRETSMY